VLTSKLQIANVAYFQGKQQLFGFSASGWLAIPINRDKWSSTVFSFVTIRQAVRYLKTGHTYTHTLTHFSDQWYTFHFSMTSVTPRTVQNKDCFQEGISGFSKLVDCKTWTFWKISNQLSSLRTIQKRELQELCLQLNFKYVALNKDTWQITSATVRCGGTRWRSGWGTALQTGR
jgi:hypothetical protein